ncbi:MAG: iron-containing alcohol dehydrogenase [Thermocrispum sp.]
MNRSGAIQATLAEVDPDGELAPCGLRLLRLGDGAIHSVAGTVTELLEPTPPVRRPVVVQLEDRTTIRRGGEDVKDLVARQLRDHYDVRRVVLDDGHAELHVVPDVVDEAARAASGVDAVVAVGGGTISDIGKVAARRLGGPGPVLVTVQTAASVDGYTDDVSVVLRDGVKRTVPSRWPDALVADAQVIAEAPAAMNRAGFGEMTSMLVAPADWKLASLAGIGTTFRPAAVRLLDRVGADLDVWSSGVRSADPGDVAELTRALALRGVATGVSGTTAVLSGVEHLVSHMLDQYNAERRLPMGLHGAQVGVAAVVAAAAWELLFDRLPAGNDVRLRDDRLDADRARSDVDKAFAAIDQTGRIAVECWHDYAAKLAKATAARPRIERLLSGWDRHEPELRTLRRPSGVIASALRAAGAAVSFAELDPAVTPDVARWAVANCALMRNRFTVVDLLTFLGWWQDADVDEVLDQARSAGRQVA